MTPTHERPASATNADRATNQTTNTEDRAGDQTVQDVGSLHPQEAARQEKNGAASTQKRPWFKFYGNNWLGDPLLRSCSLRARAVMIDLVCVTEEASPRGYLLINGQPPSDANLVSICREPGRKSARNVLESIRELVSNGVLSRDDSGRIYSRRIVRLAQKEEQDKRNGRSGGNPKLRAEGVNPTSAEGVNPQRIEDRGQRIDKDQERERARVSVEPDEREKRRSAGEWKPGSQPSATPSRKGSVSFAGTRIRVPGYWQADFEALLGGKANGFDFQAVYLAADAEATASGVAFYDDKAQKQFVLERICKEAGIAQPSAPTPSNALTSKPETQLERENREYRKRKFRDDLRKKIVVDIARRYNSKSPSSAQYRDLPDGERARVELAEARRRVQENPDYQCVIDHLAAIKQATLREWSDVATFVIEKDCYGKDERLSVSKRHTKAMEFVRQHAPCFPKNLIEYMIANKPLSAEEVRRLNEADKEAKAAAAMEAI